jgi:hypothetical protein
MVSTELRKKYVFHQEFYDLKVVNDIIFNENTHTVSVFKDYLIIDDVSEFLKRYYVDSDSEKRLPSIFEFYEEYAKVFPNYSTLAECKYMFRNIKRK